MASALDRFEGPLLRYASRLTGDAERARDVVQEVFLALCRADTEAIDGHLAAWLHRVCRNRALDVLRKQRPIGTLNTKHPPAATSSVDTCGLNALLDELEQLPPRQQEVLRLRFQSGLRYHEIADVLGLSEGNVGFIIHTGLRTLRVRLNHREVCGATTESSKAS